MQLESAHSGEYCRRPNIVIVEDDHDIRVTLREILEIQGYQVFSAANGKDGLEKLAEITPSVILLDLMMPVMDGWEFLRNKEQDPSRASVPVVVMSASGKIPHPRPNAYIPKPICLDGLLAITEKLCKSPPRASQKTLH